MSISLESLLKKKKPLVMGILNCTPDSFYEGSRNTAADESLKKALSMVEEGVDILDIGGESSRPGSSYVSAEEELSRVIPLVEAIRKESSIPISIDTRKEKVARKAVEAGADIINDISALEDDPALGPFIAEMGLPIILMHKQGTPDSMQDNPYYDNVMISVKGSLGQSVSKALSYGIDKRNIVLDPGIGFGKRQEDNINLLKGIEELKDLGYPILIGLSRKRFLGNITGRETEERLAGTIAANLYSAMKGADILRVHDVAETIDALKVLKALL